MIAQLDQESMSYVVQGPEGRSGGLVGCALSLRPNSYDHKRHHAMRQLSTHPQNCPLLPMWDFVVIRADNTAVRLHPECSQTSLAAIEVDGVAGDEVMQPPKSGLGRSDGPGNFKAKIGVAREKKLRFDARRRQ